MQRSGWIDEWKTTNHIVKQPINLHLQHSLTLSKHVAQIRSTSVTATSFAFLINYEKQVV